MKLYLYLIRNYFRLASSIIPGIAANQAFQLFQKTRRKSFLNNRDHFYQIAKPFSVPFYLEDLQGFEMGQPNGKLVFLVHGWDSHAGRLSAIAEMLGARGYRVIALNLPAHGNSKLKKTNLKFGSEAILALLKYLNPNEPFSVITHSFGSAVTTYALAKTNYTVDQLIMITTPNRLIDVFCEFKEMICLGEKAFQLLLEKSERLLGESLKDLTIAERVSMIDYKNLTLIHDPFDKILPVSNSKAVVDSNKNSRLVLLEGIGHTRILWNEKTLIEIRKILSISQPEINVDSVEVTLN